jgi:hypothetical protein
MCLALHFEVSCSGVEGIKMLQWARTEVLPWLTNPFLLSAWRHLSGILNCTTIINKHL